MGIPASQAQVNAHGSGTAAPKKGGAVTVPLDNTQWPELDPATDPSDGADVEIMGVIFGTLFEESPSHVLEPDLATS